ncbi:hypothetical protein D3C80_1987370 [compost metagenome]
MHKPTGQRTDIEGVEELAKHLGVPVSEILPVRMFKVTYDDNVVHELLPSESDE